MSEEKTLPVFPLTLQGKGICPLCLEEIEVYPPEVRFHHWRDDHGAKHPTRSQVNTAIQVARGGDRPVPIEPTGLPPES